MQAIQTKFLGPTDRRGRTLYLVISADQQLEGVYEVEAEAYGYLRELRGIGVPGLRVEVAVNGLQAYCRQLERERKEQEQ